MSTDASAPTGAATSGSSARVQAAVASARGQRTRRSLVVDALLVLGSVGYAVWAIKGDRSLWTLLPPWWLPVDVSLGILASVLLWWRRRHPVLVAGVLAVLGGVFITAGIPALIAVYTVASVRRARTAVILAAVHLAIAIPYYLVVPLGGLGIGFWSIVMILVYVTALAVGLSVHARRQVIAGLVTAAETERREHEALLQRARDAERARIAREMHDVLAHRLSLLSVHAGALERRTGPDAAVPATSLEIQQAATVIRSTAHVALEELRDVLHLLGSGGALGVAAPQPAAADLDALVAEAVVAGQRVTMHIGDRERLAELRQQLQRTIFRTVQEGMTNARKHAPGSLVDVSITAGAESVEVRVSNPLAIGITPTEIPSAGAGLAGLAERVELDGGRFTTEVHDGAFWLQVWLPWRS